MARVAPYASSVPRVSGYQHTLGQYRTSRRRLVGAYPCGSHGIGLASAPPGPRTAQSACTIR
eukprot:2276834-Rhodomonas_salina.2